MFFLIVPIINISDINRAGHKNIHEDIKENGF